MYTVPVRAVIATEWTFLGLCLVFIIARLYLRLHLQRKRLILSDYIICLAFLGGVVMAVLDIKLMQTGWLRPGSTWFNPRPYPSQAPLSRRIAYATWFPMFTVQYLAKAALLTFYFYIFPGSLARFVVFLWIVVAYSVLSFVVTILIVFMLCPPYFSELNPNGHCSSNSSLIIWTTTWALHFSSDIFIFLLPFPILRGLQMGCRKKAGLYLTFGFGVLSMAASVLRFILLVGTYAEVPTTNLQLWCAIDALAGLVAAVLPSLRPYLNMRRDFPQRIPSFSKRLGSKDSSGREGAGGSISIPPEVYTAERPGRVGSRGVEHPLE